MMPPLPVLALVSSTAFGGDPAQSIADNGPGDDWSATVGAAMLTYDTDGSGKIDQASEVDGIPCAVWKAVDDGVRRDWSGTGVRVIDGVDDGYIWVGYAFNIDEGQRPHLREVLDRCGVTSETLDPNAAVNTSLRDITTTDPTTFNTEVRATLLGRFDADKSGSLDRRAELATIPCTVWTALDDGTRARWSGVGMIKTYGVSDGMWVGDAIGLGAASKADVADLLQRCEVTVEAKPEVGSTSPSDSGASVDTSNIHSRADVIAAISAAAGSDDFDAVTTAALLSVYDMNDSGVIEKGKELKAITCDVWFAIEGGVREEWGSSLRVIYGFAKDFIWVGYALGIDEKARKSADKALAVCGIEA